MKEIKLGNGSKIIIEMSGRKNDILNHLEIARNEMNCKLNLPVILRDIDNKKVNLLSVYKQDGLKMYDVIVSLVHQNVELHFLIVSEGIGSLIMKVHLKEANFKDSLLEEFVITKTSTPEESYTGCLDTLAKIRAIVLADRHFYKHQKPLLLNVGLSINMVKSLGGEWIESFKAGFIDGYKGRCKDSIDIISSEHTMMFFNKKSAYDQGFDQGVEFKRINK